MTAAGRDDALTLLRDITAACAVGAIALLGAFTLIAALTVPGTNASNPATAAPAETGNPTQSDDGELQPPSRGQLAQVGGGSGVAVSGGSR